MREVIEPTRVVMVEVRKDHGMDILGRIDTHRLQTHPYFLHRRDPDGHLLIEGVPAWKVARHRIAPSVARINEKAAVRVLDQKTQDRNRLDPVRVAKDIDLATQRPTSLTAGLLRGLHTCFSCLDGDDTDHPSPPAMYIKERMFFLYIGTGLRALAKAKIGEDLLRAT